MRNKITREDQDRWAERSQKQFAAAQAAGRFATEIVGVDVKGRKGPDIFDKDEANRPETTLELLTRLKPAFRKDGTIAAGNAPGLNTGAAAMIVANREFADRHRLEAVARLVAYGVAAVEPGLFGIGPVPAVQQALERAHWNLRDLERMEINEAFAAVPLAVLRELGLPEDIEPAAPCHFTAAGEFVTTSTERGSP